MNMNDKEILNRISKEKNHTPSTKTIYRVCIEKYTNYFGMTLTDLLTEADEEEEQGIRWKKRKLRARLIEYRQHLYENYKPRSVDSYFGTILSIYRHFEFELQPLPKYNTKHLNQKPLEYKDLPDKEILKEAVQRANPVIKALILFISSTGTSRIDCLNLRVIDYIEATYEYHKLDTTNIYEVIQKLEEIMKTNQVIVPRFDIQRQKTGVHYFTFTTPEAISTINNYLLTRETLKPSDKLFKINYSYLNQLFIKLNDEMELGTVGTYHRLRTHMIRKYHASNLKRGKYGLSEDIINELQGRVKPGVNQSYFFEQVEDIRAKYVQAMPNLLLFWESETITLEDQEVQKVMEENQYLRDNIKELAAKAVQDAIQNFYK